MEHLLQMSLLHQDKTGASNGVLDPMQFQHQQLLSQFQRNVSNYFINTFVQEKKNKKRIKKCVGWNTTATLCVFDIYLMKLNINIV